MAAPVRAKDSVAKAEPAQPQAAAQNKPAFDISKSSIVSLEAEPHLINWNAHPLTPATMHVTDEMRAEADRWLARIAALEAGKVKI